MKSNFEKFSKKSYSPELEAERKRRKKSAHSGHNKFKDRFFRVVNPVETEGLY